MAVPGAEYGTVRIIIGGQSYTRFLSFNLRRSLREQTCSGTVVLAWEGTEQFERSMIVAPAFVAGGHVVIMLDGQLAGTGNIDTRISKGTPKHYELTLQFRGEMANSIDSMPDHESGQENRQMPGQIIQKFMQGMPGGIIDMSGGGGRQQERFIAANGETIGRIASRVARTAGLNLHENAAGMWVLSKGGNFGEGTGSAVELGRNIHHWSVKEDMAPRFENMGMAGSAIATDEMYGEEAQSLLGEGIASMANGNGRNGVMNDDGDHDQQSIQGRGKHESDSRSGQGLNVTTRMSTWSDDGGALWTVGRYYHVSIPIDNVNQSMVLDEVEFELTPDSRSATLTFVDEGSYGGAGGVLYDKYTNKRVGSPEEERDRQIERERKQQMQSTQPATMQPAQQPAEAQQQIEMPSQQP